MAYAPTDEDLVKMGQRLRRVQTLLGLTDEQMATSLGITVQHYRNRIIKGKNYPSPDRLISLVYQYKISIDYLITGDEERGILVTKTSDPVLKEELQQNLTCTYELLKTFIDQSFK